MSYLLTVKLLKNGLERSFFFLVVISFFLPLPKPLESHSVNLCVHLRGEQQGPCEVQCPCEVFAVCLVPFHIWGRGVGSDG